MSPSIHRITVAVALGLVVACSNASAGDPLKLPGLGLVIDVPGGDAVHSDPGKDWPSGPPDVQIHAGKLSFDIAAVTASYPATLPAAKAEVEHNPRPAGRRKVYPPLELAGFTKEQAIDGGWHLEYDVAAPPETTRWHGVLIRRTIDGKQYQCGGLDLTPDGAAKIAKACLGLRKS